VDADAASPLRDFRFEQIDIEARAGGHLIDVQGWQFRRTRLVLQEPLVLHDAAAVQGLAPEVWRIDREHRRRDVSALGSHVQDVS
jgi:hypothetical protein